MHDSPGSVVTQLCSGLQLYSAERRIADLERYGQNVPLLARQILIPVLAVGLCYGIETDVVQMVAQYIIRLLTARGELDSVLRAAFCHHPENYISLMEYYAPEEHGMEPFTRK